MKNLFEELVNLAGENANTNALTFLKHSFAGIFESETGITVMKEVKPSAFTDDHLDFDNFCDMLGFVHFGQASKEIVQGCPTPDDLNDEQITQLTELSDKSKKLILNLRKTFDVSVLSVVSSIIKALGHDAQVIEVNAAEFKKQMREMQEEDGNA